MVVMDSNSDDTQTDRQTKTYIQTGRQTGKRTHRYMEWFVLSCGISSKRDNKRILCNITSHLYSRVLYIPIDL